jgi:putative addiction module component (TIGR02574 family)
MDITKLEAEARELPPKARAKLAHRLLESLDSLSDSETHEFWMAEAERRAAELDSGAAQLVSAEELDRRVQARLR